jgi:hypothetical protein
MVGYRPFGTPLFLFVRSTRSRPSKESWQPALSARYQASAHL